LGFAICRYVFKNCKSDEYKAQDQARELIPGDELQAYRSVLVKITGLAKGMLISNERDAFDLCTQKGDSDLVLIRIGIEPDKASEKDEQRAFEQMARDVLALMTKAKSDTSRVDYDDMWWLPIAMDLRAWGYDAVLCDEFQDLNYCQLQLLKKVCKRGTGRIFLIGDKNQVIYEFRGGSVDMMRIAANELRAKVLPLHVTYRCDRTIVDCAKEIVDEFTARPGAPDGLVEKVETKDYAAVYDLSRPGDFIISRKNAPLLSLCIGFLKRGVPATIRGRKDVASIFLGLIDRSKAKTLDKLLAWVDKWEAREVKRLTKKNPEADTSAATDTAEAIRVLASDVDEVSEIRAKVEVLFTDGDDSKQVVLTNTHKVKGLERGRCVVLADTFRRGGEESRLWYVAVTRAKHELYLVRNEKKRKEA
jgi:superfamily I DNA/RNA helicase